MCYKIWNMNFQELNLIMKDYVNNFNKMLIEQYQTL